MLEKLSRLLKIKQRLRLHPVSESHVFAEVDRFSVSRIEVSVVGSSGRGLPYESYGVIVRNLEKKT